MEQNELKKIVGHFAIRGTVSEIKPLGAGLINDTLKVKTAEADQPDYVLQRVNTNVFPDVEMVMRNIYATTSHIRKKLEAAGESDIDRKVLRFIPLADGSGQTWCCIDGAYWRVSVFIPDAFTYDKVDPVYSEFAGQAFGRFEAQLADIPDTLGETIPDFHNMEFRARQLKDAIAADKAGRLAKPEVQAMLADIQLYIEEMCLAERLHREGKLP